jgi:cell division protein FtsL
MSVVRILYLFVGLVAIAMGMVALRNDTRQAGYLITRQWARQQDLKREYFRAELDLARQRNPVRLEAESKRLDLKVQSLSDAEPDAQGHVGAAAH